MAQSIPARSDPGYRIRVRGRRGRQRWRAAQDEPVRFVDYDARDKVAYLAKVLLWHKCFAVPPIALVPSVTAELKEADQGDLQESLHPNHFGQQAVGTCLRQFWSQFGSKGRGPASLTCQNGGSGRVTDMVLHELSSSTTAMLGQDARR